jgi:hypothetical protein
LLIGAVGGMLAAIGCVAAVTGTQAGLDDVSRGPSVRGSSFPDFGSSSGPSIGSSSSFPTYGAPSGPSIGSSSSFPTFGAPVVRAQEVDRSLIPQTSGSGSPSAGSSSFPTFGSQ